MASNTLVSGHELNRLLDRVVAQSTSLKASEFQKLLDDNQRAGLQRILFFSQQLKEHLVSVSDFEVSVQALDTLNNQMQSVLNEIGAFYSNRNSGHITNAAANLDGAIQTFGWAFYKRPSKGSTAYGETIHTVEKAAETAFQGIEKSRGTLADSLTDLQNQITGQQGILDALKQASQDLSSQNTAALQNFENKYNQLAAQLSEDFSEKLNGLETRFDTFEDAKIEQSSKLIENLEAHESAFSVVERPSTAGGGSWRGGLGGR